VVDQLNWGVLGPGGIARTFARQLPLSRTGRLVAVRSRDAGRAAAFATEFGVARSYGSYEELLADHEVEAVYIATPHPAHPEWVIRAAVAGKHVLCEKPLAVTWAHAMAAVDAARQYDVFLMEAFMYRHHPQLRVLTDLVRDGVLGTVAHVQASFSFATALNPDGRLFAPSLGGGGILDVGGYPVSAARLVAGAARGLPFADPIGVTGAGRIGETGVDEWAVATLDFGAGLVAQVATGVRVAADNTLRVSGSEGYAEVPDPWLPPEGEPGRVVLRLAGAEVREITTPPAAQYALEADSVAEHLADRESPVMSWSDSLGNATVLDRWRQAIGLTYPMERAVPPLPARPRRHDMPTGTLPGIAKPLSRLVMGVDNQRDLTHATVMFDDFVARGGNTFDTAWLYGNGALEPLLGKWIRTNGIRDEVVVIGKGAHTPHCDPESLRRQLAESLDRLDTDHVDLYLMHRDNLDVPVDEFVDVLEEERAAGRLTAYGVSNWTLERVDAAQAYATRQGKAGFAALSNHFSLAEAYALPWDGCEHVTDAASQAWLREHDLALLPWSSQARGFFAGNADDEVARCYHSESNFGRRERARELATELGVPTTAVALAFVLHQPFATFPLIGPRTLEETHGSLRALEVALTPAQVEHLANG